MSTRNFVPRADGEGSIGTEAKNWGAVYAKDLYAENIHNESEDRQPEQVYSVGDVATSSALPAGEYLQCVEGGTAGSGSLVIPDTSVGSLVQDGGVLWKILSYTYGSNVLTRSTQYSEGDLLYCPALPSGMYLVCTTEGTTGAQEPTAALSVAIDGAQIVDGTVTWTACSINQYYVPMLFRNKAYAVGDIAYSRNLPSYLRLECVVAGTTGSTEPDFSTSTGGGIIVDGGCTFIIDDVRDGTPVGRMVPSTFVPSGYVKCEGGTVNRSNYPRLVALANKYSLWTTTPATEPGKFGQGNGSTTMVLPNWKGRFIELNTSAGGAVAAGLPNITGTLTGIVAFTAGAVSDRALNWGTAAKSTAQSTSNAPAQIELNASLSNPIYSASTTVQPPAINVFAIMRY